ncbi:MAG: hypothetical protein KZQ83_09025 [gamma proteobacterium symbiont of Taylorina sp.]|nr:hypothetical protein [gamma proteobacterium symbiont of Taylorina sp.]
MSPVTGTTSANPDLDWSQLKETVLMLNLAIAQIEHSMHEGNASIDTLVNSFTALSNNLNDIQASVTKIDSNGKSDNETIKMIIQGSSATATEKVQSAIIAFQFYDKLSQRLEHVSHSLSSLTDLMADPNALYSPPKWQALQTTIREKYTMEEERRMFDKVLAGATIEEALEEFKNELESKADDSDDIEFF